MNVAGITITLTAHDGFYFDHNGYARPCIFVTADRDPMYAIDLENLDDTIDPDECFATTEEEPA